MPKVTFIQPDGEEIALSVDAGQSLMEAATKNDVQGILAECGGACACATCHVVLEGGPVDALVPAGPMEIGMLEGALNTTEKSRLSCQIEITDALDGLILRVPESQF